GIARPVRRYRSPPQSNSRMSSRAPARAAAACSTGRVAAMTSGPTPSPGMTAMRMSGTTASPFYALFTTTGLTSSLSALTLPSLSRKVKSHPVRLPPLAGRRRRGPATSDVHFRERRIMASMASRSTALFAAAALFSTVVVGTAAPAAAADTPGLPGRYNAITDVPGIHVGQVQSTRAPYLTGTTVVYTPRMAVTGVDQRGGAPATKETDLLDPLNSNPGVNAVMLGGSSMYGLAATDGVIRWLEERGEGVRVGGGVAPIVPAADIYDLGRGGDFRARTTPEWGWLA